MTSVYRVEYYLFKKTSNGQTYRLPDSGKMNIQAFSSGEAINVLIAEAGRDGYIAEIFSNNQLTTIDRVSRPIVQRIIKDCAGDYIKQKSNNDIDANQKIEQGLQKSIWKNSSL
jgi:hypothetical protein